MRSAMAGDTTTSNAQNAAQVETKPKRLWSVYDAQRLERLIETERHLACLIAASGIPGDRVFDDICLAYEELVPGAVCTIMELSGTTLDILASPSVPESMRSRLNGVQVGQGSCGAAIKEGGPVFVPDVYKDERCQDLISIFDLFKLRSCWSIPFRDERSQLVGTFAINQQSPAEPNEVDRRILETAGHVVSLAYIRREAEARAHSRDLEFRQLAEALADGLLMTNLDGSVRHINKRFTDLTGYHESDFAGRLPREVLIPAEEMQRLADVMVDRRRGIDRNYESKIRRKDGSTFWAEVRASSHYDSKNNRAGSLATVSDISERKRAEIDLKLTQFAVDSASEAMFTTGQDGLIRSVNQTVCDRLGYSRDELVGMHLTDFVPDFDRREWTDHWKRLKSIRQFVVESTHQARDGRIIPVEVSVALFEMDGESYRCSFARDITERKSAEQKLQESQQHIQAIAEHVPGVAYIFERTNDGPRELVYMGSGLDELLGPANAKRVEQEFDQMSALLHPDDRAVTEAAGAEAIRRGRAVPRKLRFRTDSGKYKWVSVAGQPVKLKGERIRWHVVALDVDRETRAEQVLVSLAEEASDVGGQDFFASLVERLSITLELRSVLVAERVETMDRYRSLAFWRDGKLAPEVEFSATDEPYRAIVEGKTLAIESGVRKQFVKDPILESLHADGFCGMPLRNSQGEVIGQLLLINDGPIDIDLHQLPALQVSAARASAELQRHRTEAVLLRSETNLRMMFNQMPAMTWTTDANLVLTSSSGRGLADIGLEPGETNGNSLYEYLEDADDGGLGIEMHKEALSGESVSFENRFQGRYYKCHIEPLSDTGGTIVGTIGICLDITEIKQSNKQLELLMRELDHRVRNNLASLIAIAQQTAARTDSVPDFLESLTGRMSSMAVAYEVISESRSHDVRWRTMLSRLLAPFADQSESVVLDGPEQALLPSLAYPLSMVVYELATNAAKHGALSNQGGRLHVLWSADADQSFSIEWREICDTPLQADMAAGFGTSVIEGLVQYQLHGTIDWHYSATGLTARINVPLLQHTHAH